MRVFDEGRKASASATKPRLAIAITLTAALFTGSLLLGQTSRSAEVAVALALLPPDRKVITVARAILAQYTGTYVNSDGNQLVVTLEGNQLVARAFGDETLLFAKSETNFISVRFPGHIEFFKDDKGAVTHGVMELETGTTFKWTRQ